MNITELLQFAADLCNSAEEYEKLGCMEYAEMMEAEVDNITAEIAVKTGHTISYVTFQIEELL